MPLDQPMFKTWMAKAEGDLTMARRAVASAPAVTDAACFHSQQAVEKALLIRQLLPQTPADSGP